MLLLEEKFLIALISSFGATALLMVHAVKELLMTNPV